MAAPESIYTEEQLMSDGVSKKDIVTFLQQNSANDFLKERRLMGKVANVAKTKSKEELAQAYKDLFDMKAFRSADEVDMKAAAGDTDKLAQRVQKVSLSEAVAEEPKYTKRVTKKGKGGIPKKGDIASVFYTGKLQDGTVFDDNTKPARRGKKPEPLRFKVGTGKVIRGWDEAILTMNVGEKCELTVQPEWAYGKKGLEGKIPPNSTLIFDMELMNYE